MLLLVVILTSICWISLNMFPRHFHNSSHLTPSSSPSLFPLLTITLLHPCYTASDVPISKSTVLDNPFSDHLPVPLCLNASSPDAQPTLITYYTFKFSGASFAADLSCVLWSVMVIFDDPDDRDLQLKGFSLTYLMTMLQ